jgi:hypothetical protein
MTVGKERGQDQPEGKSPERAGSETGHGGPVVGNVLEDKDD